MDKLTDKTRFAGEGTIGFCDRPHPLPPPRSKGGWEVARRPPPNPGVQPIGRDDSRVWCRALRPEKSGQTGSSGSAAPICLRFRAPAPEVLQNIAHHVAPTIRAASLAVLEACNDQPVLRAGHPHATGEGGEILRRPWRPARSGALSRPRRDRSSGTATRPAPAQGHRKSAPGAIAASLPHGAGPGEKHDRSLEALRAMNGHHPVLSRPRVH